VKNMVGKAEYIEVMAALITTAFALIAALAWQAAIQAIFVEVLGTSTSIPATLSYAIIVTIIAVLATIWIARVAAKAAGEEAQAGKEEAQ
jgi:uncharacterized membrane protein YidH (DUF202 family)